MKKLEEIDFRTKDLDFQILGEIALSCGSEKAIPETPQKRGEMMRVLLNKKGFRVFKEVAK